MIVELPQCVEYDVGSNLQQPLKIADMCWFQLGLLRGYAGQLCGWAVSVTILDPFQPGATAG